MNDVAERRSYDVTIAEVKTIVTAIKEDTTKIHDCIYGNSGVGLKTKVALNAQSVKRAWWFLGAISLGILGLALYIIRGGVT